MLVIKVMIMLVIIVMIIMLVSDRTAVTVLVIMPEKCLCDHM